MNLDALKPFFHEPCMRMKEVCEIITEDYNLILYTAYKISLLIISNKINVFMGDRSNLESFIIKCESLFSKPIQITDYIDYMEQPNSDKYDIVLGVAHTQYSELLDMYYPFSLDLHISPKEVYEAYDSFALRNNEPAHSGKIMKRYLTGKEIFDAGICTPVELGEKCWDGTITAWDETGAAQYSSRELWEEMKCGCHSWQVIPFPFDFGEYAKDCGGSGLASASEYKSDLSRMLFEVDEVEKVFSVPLPAVQAPELTGKPAHERAVPASTGSNKDTVRIEQTRSACEKIRKEIEQGEHGFRVQGKYKINRAHFQKAVQILLGSEKEHRDTLRDEWAKVPENIKHSGRVPDQ